MATYYVRSTDGNNADDGLSWANADADLHTPTWAAGDTIYVSQVHAQSTAAAITIATNGTLASPTRVVCANDGAEPPTAVAATGSVTTTGANNIIITGSAFFEGVIFSATSGSNNGGIAFVNTTGTAEHQLFNNCTFRHGSTATTPQSISVGSTAATTQKSVVWKDCDVKFAGTGNRIYVASSFRWDGGAFESGTASPTSGGVGIFGGGTSSSGAGADAIISGVDFSQLSSTTNLVQAATYESRFVFRNCKLPASWSGSLISSVVAPGVRVEMYNCDSADTNYRLWIEDYAGSIKHTTSVYNDAGATDGTTRQALIMASSANAEYPTILLESPEIVKRNETTGSSITVTVEIVHDSQGSGTNGALKDDEIWLEVMYLGTSGTPLGTFVRDSKADILATVSDQASSTASWTGDAAGWDTQKLAVTFTPQEKGFIHARVILAKASATVYVDPMLTIS